MDPIIVAILRAFVGGVVVGAATGLSTYSSTNDIKASVVSGGSTCLAYWIVRGGFEGVADQVRNPSQNSPLPIPVTVVPGPAPVAPPTPLPSPAPAPTPPAPAPAPAPTPPVPMPTSATRPRRVRNAPQPPG